MDDLDEEWKRIVAVLGGEELERSEAIKRWYEHLSSTLKLPVVVTGIEDFRWEERFVIGGHSPTEYARLKKTQPSYRDTYKMLELYFDRQSPWMMFCEDLTALCRRESDGKEFVLGLADIRTKSRSGKAHQAMQDYVSWFVNTR